MIKLTAPRFIAQISDVFLWPLIMLIKQAFLLIELYCPHQTSSL